MRHAIGLLAVILSIAISSRAAEPGANTSSCPGTLSTSEPALQQQYAEFRQSIESAPFARRLGPPLTCAVRAEGGSVWLEYEYAKGGKLEAHRDSAIELTGLSKTTALILLQRTERWAFDGKGCGISWKKPPAREPGATSDRHDLAYRGADCNCQGRIEYNGAALTGLVFRSTC
jgi:hypothetical protein